MSEETENAPARLFVLFEDYPSINLDHLRDALLDEAASLYTASELSVQPRPAYHQEAPKRDAALLALGPELQIILIAEEGPLPAETTRKTLEAPGVPPETREALARHSARVELAAIGEATPLEVLEGLLRVSLALAQQGALGIANPTTWSATSIDHLASRFALAESWQALREDAAPTELLLGMIPIQLDDHLWVLSRGMRSFDYPELALKLDSPEQLARTRLILNHIFTYLFSKSIDLNPQKTFSLGQAGGPQIHLRPPSGTDPEFLHLEPTMIIELVD